MPTDCRLSISATNAADGCKRTSDRLLDLSSFDKAMPVLCFAWIAAGQRLLAQGYQVVISQKTNRRTTIAIDMSATEA